MKLLILFSILFSYQAEAAKVAVVDSGTDFSHQHLSNSALVNQDEIKGNKVDDDDNGKVDDIVGWNIVEHHGKVFAPEHLPSIKPSTYKLMRIIARIQEGTITTQEADYLETHFQSLPDDEKAIVINDLNYFGQYAHGTHVSGTVINQSPESQILAVRVFPDMPPDVNFVESRGIKDFLYGLLATFANGSFKKAGAYINEREIDIANMSLGAPLALLAEQFLKIGGNKNPSPEEIEAEAQLLYSKYEVHGKEWMAAAPDTLFVVAAGNSATNNDRLPNFPSNVDAPNKISVAATKGFTELADFSCYGAETVDIAAPGVAEVSSVPHLNRTEMMPMSGTSMSSPYVAGVAAAVKSLNPELTPELIKRILMETVDKKDWLEGKVLSSGVVNSERAQKAATLAREMSLDAAISRAQNLVSDVKQQMIPRGFSTVQPSRELKELAEQFIY